MYIPRQAFAFLWIALAVVLAGCNPPQPANGRKTANAPLTTLVLADTGQNFFTAPTILLRDQNLLSTRGVQLKVIDYPTGLAAKNAVLSRSADLGVVAITPVAAGTLRNEKGRLISTYVRSRAILKVATLRSPGSSRTITLADLKSEWPKRRSRVGYVTGTVSEMLFDRLLQATGVTRSQLRAVALKPNLMGTALINGDVDYILIWEPFILRIPNSSGFEPSRKVLATMKSGSYYEMSLSLVTRPDVVASKSPALIEFLRTLGEVCENMKSNPETYRSRTEKLLHHKEGELSTVWNDIRFDLLPFDGVTADQKIAAWRKWSEKQLLDEAAWVSNKTPSPKPEVPDNMADYIDDSIIRAATAK